MIFERCKTILIQESELVQRAAVLQRLIRDAVEKREWADFEGHFSDMNALGQELAALEQERESLFAELRGGAAAAVEHDGDKGCFYALVSRLPAEQRNELTAIYRSLKLESLKLRMANDTLMAYISEARATMAGFFALAFPDRRGQLYTPRGTTVSHDMRSMVLNQRM